jgi:hypothetical protein
VQDGLPQLIETLKGFVLPAGMAAFAAGAVLKYVPPSKVRDELAFVIHLGKLLSVALWMFFWSRHMLPGSGFEVGVLANVVPLSFIAISTWELPYVYRRLHTRRKNHDIMET